jgi:hypothetical protein
MRDGFNEELGRWDASGETAKEREGWNWSLSASQWGLTLDLLSAGCDQRLSTIKIHDKLRYDKKKHKSCTSESSKDPPLMVVVYTDHPLAAVASIEQPVCMCYRVSYIVLLSRYLNNLVIGGWLIQLTLSVIIFDHSQNISLSYLFYVLHCTIQKRRSLSWVWKKSYTQRPKECMPSNSVRYQSVAFYHLRARITSIFTVSVVIFSWKKIYDNLRIILHSTKTKTVMLFWVFRWNKFEIFGSLSRWMIREMK